MPFTKVAPAGIGTEPGDGYRIGDSFLHATGLSLGSGTTISHNGSASFSGIVTASSFVGSGSGLTGVASTDHINSSTNAVLSGIVTAGTLNVSGNATVTGTLGVGGTITYEDVTNVDSVGIITARTDIHLGDKLVHYGDTNTAIRFPAADTVTVETGGSEALRIDSSQRLQMGSASDNLGAAKLNIVTGGDDGISLGKVQGATVSSGDVLGTLAFQTAIGAQTTNSAEASIKGIAAENSSGSTAATNMAFFTKPTGVGPGSSPTERLRILGNGHVAIGDDIANDTGMFKVIAADGQSDDQYVGQFKNLEATTNRNWGLLIQAGSSSTDESFRVRNGANNADHLTVRGDGVVTKPKTPTFSALGSGDAISAQSPLPYDSMEYNNGNHYNNSTYKFTCPVTGYYYVTCHVVPTNFSTPNNVELYIKDQSGNRYFLDRKVKSNNYSTNNFSVGGSRILYKSAGNTLWVEFNSINGSPTLEGSSHFGIMLMA